LQSPGQDAARYEQGVLIMTQSQHYEQQADALTGAEQERALRAAQNALQQTSPTYMADFKRLQGKLIACLEAAQ